MSRYCPYCGTANEQGGLFCAECGKQLPKPPVPAPEPIPAPASIPEPVSEPTSAQYTYENPYVPQAVSMTEPREKANNNKTIVLLVIALVAVLLVGVFLIWYFSQDSGGRRTVPTASKQVKIP